MSPEVIVQLAMGAVVSAVGFLLKRSIDANDAQLRTVALDVKSIVATLSQQHADLAVATSRIDRAEREIGTLQERIHELAASIARRAEAS